MSGYSLIINQYIEGENVSKLLFLLIIFKVW